MKFLKPVDEVPQQKDKYLPMFRKVLEMDGSLQWIPVEFEDIPAAYRAYQVAKKQDGIEASRRKNILFLRRKAT